MAGGDRETQMDDLERGRREEEIRWGAHQRGGAEMGS